MVMTALIRHAKQLFIGERGGVLDPSLVVQKLLHADDTLLMDASEGSVEQYMLCVEEVGAELGMTFELMPVRRERVRRTNVKKVRKRGAEQGRRRNLYKE